MYHSKYRRPGARPKTADKPFDCTLCPSGPFSGGGLLMHARAKHAKKFWKMFYSCRACDFYVTDEASLREHYRTSSVHRSCDTCQEPFYDLQISNAPVLYKQHSANLSRCDECGRCTFSPHIAKSGPSLINSDIGSDTYDAPEFEGTDDLETTVGAF